MLSAPEWIAALTFMTMMVMLREAYGWAVLALGLIIGLRREPLWVVALVVLLVGFVVSTALTLFPGAHGWGKNTAFFFSIGSGAVCAMGMIAGRIVAWIISLWRPS